MNGWNAGIIKTISYQKSTKTRTPHRYNTNIQSLRAGFTEGGGDVTALAENGGTRWAWSHVTKGSYKTSLSQHAQTYLSKLRRDSVSADFQLVYKLTNYVYTKPP